MLSDSQISWECQGKNLPLISNGFHYDRIQPASYDLTLASNYRVAKHEGQILDCWEIEEDHTYLKEAEKDEIGRYIDLPPGDFILATTLEQVNIPDYLSARVEGKSSLGRIGLAVHITAGFIDPGFRGNITLEIANLGSWVVRLRPGMRIAQIAFTRMEQSPINPYGKVNNHYQHQRGPTESRFRMKP
jgi:dCTP deaminase